MSPRKSSVSTRHPIVSAFLVDSRRMSDLIREQPEPREPVLQAILDLEDSLDSGNQARMERARELASSVSLGGVDLCLSIYFLARWSVISGSLDRLDEAELLCRRAQALFDGAVPVEMRTMILSLEGFLAGKVHGNNCRRLESSMQALRLLNPESPHYPRALLACAFDLARFGMLSEVEKELRSLDLPAGSRESAHRAYELLCGYAEVGRLDVIDDLLAAARSEAGERQGALRDMIATCAALIDLMRGRWIPPGGRWATIEEAGGMNPAVLWPASTQLLLDRRPEEALRWARAFVRSLSDLDLRGWDTFANYTMLRAELAVGNQEAARRFLLSREACGDRRYLDSFFLARVEMLAGNRETAARHFSTLLAAVERYGAQGRLDFELRLAIELSPGDLARLAHTAAVVGRQAAVALRTVEAHEPRGSDRLIGPSRAMESVRQAVIQFAGLDVPVLITGETGTGKELVARALHEAGPRAAEPFLAINCGAIAETLLETELFGHEKGAFTGAAGAHRGIFEEAGRGTVLLDEIGDITPRIQVALLRVLETGEVRPVGASRSRRLRCRILAATNADLAALTEGGAFRKDLYFRLRRLVLHLPPLRERREDILPLAELFLREDRQDGRQPEISSELSGALAGSAWPGNVRELRNAIERMRLLHSEKLAYDLVDYRDGADAGDVSVPVVPSGEFGARSSPTDSDGAASVAAGIGEDIAERVLRQARTQFRRLDRVRELFRRHERLTRSELSKILAVQAMTVTRDLKILCAEGFIEKVRPTGSPQTHYFRLRSS